MVLPLIAAAAIPEITKALATAGGTKDVCFMDFIYQPMIKIRKNQPKLLEKYPEGEYPNPRYPTGIRYQVPAWLLLGGTVGVGAVAGGLLYAETQGWLGPLKEALGLKKKKK